MTDVQTHTKESIGDTAINQDPATMTLTYGDYKVAVSELPAKAIAYLLQNGFSQSMTDAAAFTKKQKQDEHGVDLPEDEISAMAKEARDARFAKIVAGEVGVRVGGGPRGNSFDTLVRAVAIESMRIKLAKYKLTLPTGKNADGSPKTIDIKGLGPMTRDALIAREIEKNGDAVRAEATRRQNLPAAQGEGAMEI